jgi:HopA1 effector protein family
VLRRDNPLAAELERVVHAFTLRRGAPYWYGARIAGTREWAEANADQRSSRLRDVLYRAYYTAGRVARLAAYQPGAPGDVVSFERSLEQANPLHDRWEKGWRITAVQDEFVVVSRGPIEFRASRDCVRASAMRSGISATVLVPSGRFAWSPGFYLVTGTRVLESDDALVRAYWNVSAEGAARFLTSGVTLLEDAGIPFQLKVATQRAGYDRADSGLVYLRRADWARAIIALRGLERTARPFTRLGTVAFAKPVAPGVGVAEDPGNGESFGQQRCRLLAEALLDALEVQMRRRCEAVLGGLTARGVDVNAPHLQRPSRQVYDCLVHA